VIKHILINIFRSLAEGRLRWVWGFVQHFSSRNVASERNTK